MAFLWSWLWLRCPCVKSRSFTLSLTERRQRRWSTSTAAPQRRLISWLPAAWVSPTPCVAAMCPPPPPPAGWRCCGWRAARGQERIRAGSTSFFLSVGDLLRRGAGQIPVDVRKTRQLQNRHEAAGSVVYAKIFRALRGGFFLLGGSPELQGRSDTLRSRTRGGGGWSSAAVFAAAGLVAAGLAESKEDLVPTLSCSLLPMWLHVTSSTPHYIISMCFSKLQLGGCGDLWTGSSLLHLTLQLKDISCERTRVRNVF